MNHDQNDGLLQMIRRTDPMIFLDSHKLSWPQCDMKRIYKCIFEILLGLIIVALCVFVFNFSLLGMESYILHYPQWLLGHCLAVLFLLCLFLFLLTICNYVACNNLRVSIKKATKFIFIVSLIIFAYIAIIGIDYGLLFHKSKKYPPYPSYGITKCQTSCHRTFCDSHESWPRWDIIIYTLWYIWRE